VDIYARAGGDAAAMERAEDEVRVLMRARRHDAPGTDDDFELETNDTFMDIWKQFTAIFFSVVVGIASISLVVGGIVIMNIMLVSVTERTREIGIRKALGARRFDIMLQILIEAVIMSFAGGAIGVAIGAICTVGLTAAFGITLRVTPFYVLLSVMVSATVGIVSGWYPALKASKLDPIVALRAE
jgi:putative ABC transport system permease protein